MLPGYGHTEFYKKHIRISNKETKQQSDYKPEHCEQMVEWIYL